MYEHIYVAEKYLGRSLRSNEIVHHLDCNPLNNRWENLLVIEDTQHVKIHSWIDRGCPINRGEVSNKFCEICNLTLQEKQIRFCSGKCSGISRSRMPPKNRLLQDFRECGTFTAVGRRYGVSDNAIRKWCAKYDMPTKKL